MQPLRDLWLFRYRKDADDIALHTRKLLIMSYFLSSGYNSLRYYFTILELPKAGLIEVFHKGIICYEHLTHSRGPAEFYLSIGLSMSYSKQIEVPLYSKRRT